MIDADLLIRGAAELCTMAGPGPSGESMLGLVAGGSVACLQGQVVWTGPDSQLEGAVRALPGARTLDASGCTVTPGFVDCHTHVLFAGERGDEFSQRCGGATYLEIAKRGGGIGATIRPTRAASRDDLVRLALPRLGRLLSFGITTAELKTGYGLDRASELCCLEAMAALPALQPVEIVPTLLCAHSIPPEFAKDREGYVRLCVEEIIPEAAKAKLARFCDAFVEEGAFTVEEGRRILSRGKELGLIPRLHADQMSQMGASRLAAELGAASADHLESIDEGGIEAMAKAKVAAVLVPVSTLFLRQSVWAPGRKLWDAGVTVALATNLNPGSAMSENAALTLSLACLMNGLSAAEALCAFTRGAARAIRMEERLGSLCVGKQADLVIHAASSHTHLPYHLAINHTRQVVKRGKVVYERELAPCAAA